MSPRCPQCNAEVHPISGSAAAPACPDCGRLLPPTDGADLMVSGHTTIPHEPGLRIVDRYELYEQIGAGGFGTVWTAHDTEFDRPVAVKLSRTMASDAKSASSFLDEAQLAARLGKHPNIVRVLDQGVDRDQLYIVCDLVDGVSLADWLTGRQPGAILAAQWCIKICRAMHFAHEQGVIHRDIKPSNILIDSQEEPHLTDFGLAQRIDDIETDATHALAGSPPYMSPEQAQGEPLDRRSDVYALSVTLYRLLTGELPFRGNMRMLLHQHIYQEPPRLRQLDNTVPRDLEAICLKGLQKDPSRRYQSADELARDLEHFLRGEPVSARPATLLSRAMQWLRHPDRVRNAGMVSLVLVGLGIFGRLWAVITLYLNLGHYPPDLDRAAATLVFLSWIPAHAIGLLAGLLAIRRRLSGVLLGLCWAVFLLSLNIVWSEPEAFGLTDDFLSCAGLFRNPTARAIVGHSGIYFGMFYTLTQAIGCFAWYSNAQLMHWYRETQLPTGMMSSRMSAP